MPAAMLFERAAPVTSARGMRRRYQPDTGRESGPQPRWWQTPETELPILVAAPEILGATEHVAVAVAGVAV